MRYIIYSILLMPLASYGQNYAASRSGQTTGSTREIQGSIHMTQLMDVKVNTNARQDATISRFEDYKDGKVIPSYFTVNLKSNRPWMLNAALANQTSGMSSDNNRSYVEIKEASSGTFIPVGSAPTPVLSNTNNNIVNSYNFDIKLNPGFGKNGGSYNLNILFTLSPR